MARKTLLTEAEIRQFMKLANIEPLQEMGGRTTSPWYEGRGRRRRTRYARLCSEADRDDEDEDPPGMRGMRDMREAEDEDEEPGMERYARA